MPVAVPLVSSSNLDCSQVRVPSARARVQTIRANAKANVLRAKVIPRIQVNWQSVILYLVWGPLASRSLRIKDLGRMSSQVFGFERLRHKVFINQTLRGKSRSRTRLLDVNRQHLCAGDY